MGPSGSRGGGPNPWMYQYGSSWKNIPDHVKRLNFSAAPQGYTGGPAGGSQQWLMADVPPPWVATRHGGGPYRSRPQAERELVKAQRIQNPQWPRFVEERRQKDAEEAAKRVDPQPVISAAGEAAKENIKKKKKKEVRQGLGTGVSGAPSTSVLGQATVRRPTLLGS